MKTLILIRHAKSDWPENTEDFDRPLADKGMNDAARMATFMKNSDIVIDKFISSPALRALDTCKIFNQIYRTDIETDRKLYNANETNFESVVYGLPDDLNSVALFSHNNGISNFANMICGDIFAFATCGAAGFELDCDSWADFENAKKKLLFYFEPKNI